MQQLEADLCHKYIEIQAQSALQSNVRRNADYPRLVSMPVFRAFSGVRKVCCIRNSDFKLLNVIILP